MGHMELAKGLDGLLILLGIAFLVVVLWYFHRITRKVRLLKRLLNQQQQEIKKQDAELLQLRAFKTDLFNLGSQNILLLPYQPEEALLLHIRKALKHYSNHRKKTKAKERSDEAEYGQTADREWLEQLERCVRENMADPQFNVDHLAELLQINRKTLYSRVREYTGFSVNQYIQEIRLYTVRENLDSGVTVNLNDLAASVGFRTSNYLSRLYRERFGMSPVKQNRVL